MQQRAGHPAGAGQHGSVEPCVHASVEPCVHASVEPCVRVGLDRIDEIRLPGKRVALLSHYAAVNRRLETSAEIFARSRDYRLTAILGPQHGFWGETQDNMIEWEGYLHPRWGVPVHSLYGETREPTPAMLEGSDCVVVDLQDVGSRYYTYVYAMAYTLRLAQKMGIPAVVLDRPNPVGMRIVEGRPQREEFLSYVGLYPVPARHALTIGELSQLFASLDGMGPPAVVRMENPPLDRFPSDFPWVCPSPNMPTAETALVYPGMCLFEGTNLSEGRGTCRPFEVFGAPWISPEELCERLNGGSFTDGAVLRPHRFIPTFGKHCGLLCGGAQIHVTDPASFRPLRMGLGLLCECFRQGGGTAWREPPYEYVRDRLPIDILAGGPDIRLAIEKGDEEALLELSAPDLEGHRAAAGPFLLYPREFTG
jgi:uncharacterized protein YbbC (DUF1343 family)